MNHQALIQSLCDDLTPVRTDGFEQRLVQALVTGGLTSALVLLAWLGVQSGLSSLAVLAPLAAKGASMLAIAAIALQQMRALARPGRPGGPLLARLGLVALLLVVLAAVQAMGDPQPSGAAAWLGRSAPWCSLRIVALSLPILGGILWTMREQAPVRLAEAGAVCGLASGGLAAAIYALACSESSMGFVLLWYSLGIAATTALGAVLGARLLRW